MNEANNFKPPDPVPSSGSGLTIIKILLACGILVFLYLQVQPKLPYLNMLFDKLKESIKSYKQLLTPVEPKKEPPEINVKSPEKTDTPKPDNGKGFCYAGEWNGVRSCIDVNSLDECYSGKMYDSKAECIKEA